MTRRLLYLTLVGSVACYSSQNSACDIGGPTPVPTPAPSPVIIVVQPSPSPSPSPAESCRIDYLTLRPSEGLILANHAEATLDLTPYQTVTNPDGSVAQREVSKACNDPRAASILWQSSAASVAFLSGGFNPTIRRVGVGVATLTATLEGRVSNAIMVRTP